MSAPVSLRALVAAIAAVAFAQLAPSCGGGGGGALIAALSVAPSEVSVDQGTFFPVDVVISTTVPVQAYQVTVKWDPTLATVVGYDPHADFDDDGVLFGTAVLKKQTGSLSDLIDLRHGPTSLAGDVHVATVWFFAGSPGQFSVTVSGKAAGSDGTKFQTITTASIVTISGS